MNDIRRKYDHPSAWTVDNVGGKLGISETLGADHITAFDQALARVRSKGMDVEDITKADFPLDSIASSLQRWINEINEGRGLMVLSGFPIENYTKEECSVIYYGLGAHFGEAQSQSSMGDRLGHVVNIGGKDTRERAYRNSAELALHTDASDIVGMMCLVKANQGGMSGYSSAPAIYNYLLTHHPELLDTLFEGYRYHLFGEQQPGEPPVTRDKVPVFSESNGYLSVCFLRSYIELAYEELGVERTAKQAEALDTFDRIAHSAEFRLNFMLEPGEICFFNNYTTLHTRTEFFEDEDPLKRRHLLRLWLKAWNKRPIVSEMSTYGARKGISKQQGKGTYYSGVEV
ncbi:MAG: hypothetical protein GKR96_05655 [Gammaproteobacteria bacterium]|nr:hypothetical protein [Gammaproteobacteria bacterium]